MNRAIASVLFLAMSLPLARVAAQEEVVPAAAVRPLEAIAVELKKANLQQEAREIVAILKELGYSQRNLDRLEQRLRKTNAARRPPRTGSLITRVKKAASRLADQIPPDGDARETVARCVVALDGSNATARQVLGDELVAGAWETAAQRAAADRRREILAAIATASALDPDIQTATSENPLLKDLRAGRSEDAAPFPLSKATYGGVTLHAAAEPERTARILRRAIAVAALVQWMLDDQLRVPKLEAGEIVLFRSVDDYRTAVEAAVKNAGINENDAEAYNSSGEFKDRRGFEVFEFCREEEATAWLARRLLPEQDDFLSLWEGCLNWSTTNVLGCWMPRGPSARYTLDFGRFLGEVEITLDSGEIHPRIYYEGEDADEHTRLAWAGLTGAYRWLAHLAESERAKPWQESFTESMSGIAGNRLLKSTSMAHMLLERGPLADVLEKVGQTQGRKGVEVRGKIETALEMSMIEFEELWQRWIHRPVSLIEKLQVAGPDQLPAPYRNFFEQLAALRKASTKRRTDTPDWKVAWDQHLSVGAQAHVAYLQKHDPGANPWPAGHEESTDADGYSEHGATAARHAVIAKGVDSPEAGLEALMATYQARVRLLNPCLIAAGIGFADGTLVVDTDSMVAPSFTEWRIAWPYRGMTDVPTHYRPIGPNPVPDKEMTELGYPITVHMGQREQGKSLRVTMQLFTVNRRDKTEVECAFLSPDSAIELAMPRAFCLVPLQPLRRGTTYEVKVLLPDDPDDIVWQFTTHR